MRGARGTPFEQLGSFASIAEAAETISKIESDYGWIFFRVSVYTLNEEPTSDADVPQPSELSGGGPLLRADTRCK
jgi:hypothetical protein